MPRTTYILHALPNFDKGFGFLSRFDGGRYGRFRVGGGLLPLPALHYMYHFPEAFGFNSGTPSFRLAEIRNRIEFRDQVLPAGNVDFFGEPNRFFECQLKLSEIEQQTAGELHFVSLDSILKQLLRFLYQEDPQNGELNRCRNEFLLPDYGISGFLQRPDGNILGGTVMVHRFREAVQKQGFVPDVELHCFCG